MLRPKRQTSGTVTVTAPIGGWNAVDPLATMPPNEAVIIDNWFCLPTELQSRKGYSLWADGIIGIVKSFINYDNANNTSTLFAVTDTTETDLCTEDLQAITTELDQIITGGETSCIFNVTAFGTQTADDADVIGLNSAHFRSAQFSNSGGDFTLAINQVDNLLIYNGTQWASISSTSTPLAITGVDTADLNDVILHKRRVWFAQNDTLLGWYLDTDAIAGTAHKFDFGPIFALGGSISKLATWTLDAGWGMDDYFIVMTSKGEVAVYKGSNPADAADWSLQGVYYIGSPVGFFPTCKYGGDVLLLNKDGLVPLSQCLMSSRVSTRISITNKIQSVITSDTSQYAANYGWQVILFPPENMLILNIPITETESYQYIMNTISGAWSRFTNINARSFAFANEQMFFGNTDKVYKFWDSQNDVGNVIGTDLLPAFSSFGSQSQIKRWTMARVSMGNDSQFAFSGQMAMDFDLITTPPTPYNFLETSAGIWDSGVWDASIWGGGIANFSRWQMATGMGHYGSYRIRTSSKTSDVRYYATDYVFEGGGVL